MPKILVIDDENIILDNIKFVLELENYEVLTASNGEEGILVFSENKNEIDAIITDMRMPKATGLDVLKAVRHMAPEISVIILTGHGDIENAILAMKEGAFEYLKKPINADNLTMSVANAVNKKKLLLENARMQSKIIEQNNYLQGLHDSAQKILIHMIPGELPHIEGFKFSAEYKSADIVGGDMYNVTDIGDYICFYIFDVISHGILASVISIILKSFIQNVEYNFKQGTNKKSFTEIISDLNVQLHLNTAQNIFATLFIGFIEKKTNILNYISAGHITQYAIIDSKLTPLNSTGTVLGIFEEEDYLCNEIQLYKGDKVLLFTDGIIEATFDNFMYGFDGLINTLHYCKNGSIDNIVSCTFNSVTNFAKDKFDDDLTILGVELL